MRKSYRVKSEQDFQKVFNYKKSIANKYFIVYQIKQTKLNHFRVGISVGKKIGNAVQRNFVKRRIRAVIYQMSNQINTDVDFIIIARPNVGQLSYKEFYKNIMHVLMIANLLKDENNEKKY